VTLTLSLPGGQERPLGQQVTDDRGEFSATDLPPGSVRIRAVAGSISAHTEIELSAGDNARTEIELR
ncbi:MAG TPA: carboxypeptidase-like regulatory domain-containing protein, partial [Pseudomonadota bacterium]|nr:carboxypeptidase-like regulatory domain-containing protein [Pseudomonadota bacterium]